MLLVPPTRQSWLAHPNEKVGSCVTVDEHASANLYLGCTHTITVVVMRKGVQARKIVHTMGDRSKTTGERHRGLCFATARDRVTRRKVATPFIDAGGTVVGPKTPVTAGP